MIAVHVIWADSAGLDDMGWSRLADYEQQLETEAVCETVGWMIAENDHSIMIARSHNRGGRCEGAIQIPRVAVQKITIARGGKPYRRKRTS